MIPPGKKPSINVEEVLPPPSMAEVDASVADIDQAEPIDDVQPQSLMPSKTPSAKSSAKSTDKQPSSKSMEKQPSAQLQPPGNSQASLKPSSHSHSMTKQPSNQSQPPANSQTSMKSSPQSQSSVKTPSQSQASVKPSSQSQASVKSTSKSQASMKPSSQSQASKKASGSKAVVPSEASVLQSLQHYVLNDMQASNQYENDGNWVLDKVPPYYPKRRPLPSTYSEINNLPPRKKCCLENDSQPLSFTQSIKVMYDVLTGNDNYPCNECDRPMCNETTWQWLSSVATDMVDAVKTIAQRPDTATSGCGTMDAETLRCNTKGTSADIEGTMCSSVLIKSPTSIMQQTSSSVDPNLPTQMESTPGMKSELKEQLEEIPDENPTEETIEEQVQPVEVPESSEVQLELVSAEEQVEPVESPVEVENEEAKEKESQVQSMIKLFESKSATNAEEANPESGGEQTEVEEKKNEEGEKIEETEVIEGEETEEAKKAKAKK